MNKEYVKTARGFRVAIYENDYGSSVDKINNLIEIAQRDFPKVKSSAISIVQYAGSYHKGKYAIEFDILVDTIIPATYDEVRELNPTF